MVQPKQNIYKSKLVHRAPPQIPITTFTMSTLHQIRRFMSHPQTPHHTTDYTQKTRTRLGICDSSSSSSYQQQQQQAQSSIIHF